MNVKPGDIAKVIEGANAGAQVYVVQRCPEADYKWGSGHAWLVEALQTVQGFRKQTPTGILWPGATAYAPDKALRRIEPPADNSLSDRIRESLGARS